ncbi:xanthine dehydrogenase subunit D [Metabacillus sediminilitoris]|uniref:Xanthine dehydrogenase subunit D n=1 Tax=Metabacillus sediminilitoris TaxID=2567941 RepID=A0A4S4BYB5_9BACI|nr:xanthine dehydrogenase subunit D [Metabacillus sediminilitoris]QGQ46036.1 xanthine dehydrogenase subunit D [Metabacillus sediminilitoris]THF79720.1 xanthine dehydrogenase subunit D [Metabacillus sediminilitoris]
MRLVRENFPSKWKVRPDGLAKVTGTLKYLTDLIFPNMLYGKVLRSSYPHAKILSISTGNAEKLEGVKAVVTHNDVPGMNRFGLIFPDQPVLCDDVARYVGDAIAAVAAESEEIAELAIKLIEVEYEPLEVIDDPEKALLQSAVKLHPGGNILHRAGYKSSEEVMNVIKECPYVVEETYETPRQMHAYMETEGGVVVPDKNGGITVYAATQHGFKDRMQLARILGMPESDIRVISSPIGGSFGGKDELNIQPYAALLALKTGRPIKLHNKRSESVRAGIKRHPMKMKMITGADEQGKLVGHYVKIIADTGAYATLGPAVLDFAVEHSTGPYLIPHVDIEGISVFTNNGVSGEYRGFGGNQVTFALESQIDRLAEMMRMDPLMLREINIRNAEDLGPLGQRIVANDGAKNVLSMIKSSTILTAPLKRQDNWCLRGRGAAITMHGGGLGFGRPDPSGARLALTKEGEIEIAFGFEEFGQGLLASIEIMMTDMLGCAKEDIKIVIGDTDLVPASGSSTASRSTNMIWQGINKLKEPWRDKILDAASSVTGVQKRKLFIGERGVWEKGVKNKMIITYKELAKSFSHNLPVCSTQYHFPTTPDAVIGGHYLHTYAAVAAEVEIDQLTGRIKVTKLDHSVAAGPVVNPLGYLGQIEGGAIMGLGFTLFEDSIMEHARYHTENFDSYLLPTIKDIPLSTNVDVDESLFESDIFGPRGVGEIGTVAVAPAITAAIHNACGIWVSKLPVSPEELLNALELTPFLFDQQEVVE